MQRKIVYFSISIILLSGLVLGILSYYIASDNYVKQTISNLNLIGNMYENRVANGGYIFDEAREIYAITNINSVIFDESNNVVFSANDQEVEENQSFYEVEIQQAIADGYGESVRFSSQHGKKYIYIAKLISFGEEEFVIRFETPFDFVSTLSSASYIYVFIGYLFIILMTLILSFNLSKKIVKPIKDINDYTVQIVSSLSDINNNPGDYPKVSDEPVYMQISAEDEIKELSESIEEMTMNLYNSLKHSINLSSRIHAVINSMPGIVIAIDVYKNLILANETAIKRFGMKDYIDEYYGNYIRNKEIKDFIEDANDLDGKKELALWDSIYIIRKTPIKLNGGLNSIIAGTVITFTDVGNIRRLEKMRSDFVSNVTHELKTPLTSIKGFVETLKNSPPNDLNALNRFLNIIDIETERLSNLINDILVLSNIENVTHDYGIVRCDLREILTTVIDVIKPIANKKNIVINLEFLKEELYAEANPDRIKQLLINLIGNAVEYNKLGGWVRVSASYIANNIIFKIEDNGIGIPKEHLDRIFERFYTVNKGRSRKNNGTGLGLSIVKHIVKLYDGKIKVESEPGIGSIFTVSLPIRCE